MEPKSKIITDKDQFLVLMPLMAKFPKIHNNLKSDFDLLIEITEQQKTDTSQFRTLCRACLSNLFSVIEADIFYFNLFDKYDEYYDKHHFLDKFKNTYKQICKTWDREDLQKEYFSSKLEDLKALKTLRDKLLHPKEIEDLIEPSFDDFEKIKHVFQDYEKFFLTIMSNFFFNIQIPFDEIYPA